MSRTQITVLVALLLLGLSAGVFFTRRATGGTDSGPTGVSSWEVTLAAGPFPKDKDGTVSTTGSARFPAAARLQRVVEERRPRSPRGPARSGEGGRPRRRRGRLEAAPDDRGERIPADVHVPLCSRHAPSDARDARGDTPSGRRPGTGEGRHAQVLPASRAITPTLRRWRGNWAAIILPISSAFHDHVSRWSTGRRERRLDCLSSGGDSAGRSRLLVALCRSRGIPAALVTGWA